MGITPRKDFSCRDIDRDGMIVKMLDHKLTEEDEDLLLFHIRNCNDCMSIVADVLFARSQFEEKGKDYNINVN